MLSSLLALAGLGVTAVSATFPPIQRAEGLISTAWYASWHYADFPLTSVAWDKYTHMTFAFAETTPDVTKIDLGNSTSNTTLILSEFVETAHANDVKTLISVGGWTGSIYWSDAVATAENRTAFVKTLLDLVQDYDLDGLDFDWEYPNVQGLGCNTISPNDTANFLEFLKELRADEFGSTLLLSVAATTPFADENGEPSADVSAFAEVLDWIAIMNYDIWGGWSETVGPNAPLDDTCAPPESQVGSAVTVAAAWNDAGIPFNQLVLAVASYGHSFAVTQSAAYPNGTDGELALYPAFNASISRPGDAWDDEPGLDACGVEQTWGGNYDFWALVEGGYLDENGEPTAEAGYIYDECTQTPFVYNATSELMISFDDPRSFAAKGKFIKDTGLAGFAMWEAGGDYKNLLLDSILLSATCA